MRWRLPHAGLIDRIVIKSVCLFARRQVRAVHGLENLRAAKDPVLFAINHTIRRESLYVPGVLDLLRGGRWIRIVGDWNFGMIPIIGYVMRRSGVIVVGNKSAKPRFLNRLKPFFTDPRPVADRVRERLEAGEAVGFFPEGTAHRHPTRLLYGRVGLSRLSLDTGIPIVPVGIRFPGVDPDRAVPEDAVMEVEIGRPMTPPADGNGSVTTARTWHASIMTEISRLSGKSWEPRQRDDDDGS